MNESAIRTPDQRLRVFVGSTLAELGPEHAAVRDVFVGIYGRRYGWVRPGMTISGRRTSTCCRRQAQAALHQGRCGGRDEQLSAMIERFAHEASTSYAHCRDPEQLARLVTDDVP